MKIVMLCDLFVETLQYQENLLAKYYVKNGHDVTVIASTFNSAFDYVTDKYDKTSERRIYNYQGIKIIKLPYSVNILNKIRKLSGFKQVLNQEKPAFIYVGDIHFNIKEIAAYKKKNECRVIIDYHADFGNSAKNWMSLNILHKVIRKRFLYRYYASIDKIFCVIPASQTFLNLVYKVPLHHTELLPLGADMEISNRVRESHFGKSIRKKYEIPDSNFLIFTGGKINAAKQTHLLIEALNKLKRKDVHVLIVGDIDKSDDEYSTRIMALANGNTNIHMVGWVNGTEVYNYMDACDFGVFPASQSVLWQQAIGMGLPLILGKVGVQDPGYLNCHNNIIILDEQDIKVDVICSKIEGLINDSERMSAMKDGAFKTAYEILDYDKLIVKTLG